MHFINRASITIVHSFTGPFGIRPNCKYKVGVNGVQIQVVIRVGLDACKISGDISKKARDAFQKTLTGRELLSQNSVYTLKSLIPGNGIQAKRFTHVRAK